MKKYRMVLGFLILVIFILSSSVVNSAKYYYNTTLAALHVLDNKALEEIKSRGVGTRFKIQEIVPEKGGISGKLIWINDEFPEKPGTKYSIFDAEARIGLISPSGKPVQAVGNANMPMMPASVVVKAGDRIILPEGIYIPSTGEGTIIRFVGPVKFQGYIFDGSKDMPLTFIVLKEQGFVYLHGKGTVILKDQKRIYLP
jgi:hypothetical protein